VRRAIGKVLLILIIVIRTVDGGRFSSIFGDLMVAKRPLNAGKPWTPAAVEQLKDLAAHNTPTRVIGIKLQRTEDAIRSKAQSEDISLKPTNQSPYGTKK
jgi:hypothetical protein